MGGGSAAYSPAFGTVGAIPEESLAFGSTLTGVAGGSGAVSPYIGAGAAGSTMPSWMTGVPEANTLAEGAAQSTTTFPAANSLLTPQNALKAYNAVKGLMGSQNPPSYAPGGGYSGASGSGLLQGQEMPIPAYLKPKIALKKKDEDEKDWRYWSEQAKKNQTSYYPWID